MAITQYVIDAFTDTVFKGNQAAVCATEEPLADAIMQNIAIENNFSETAFLVPIADKEGCYSLRWFTPGGEIDLCGHATLASAFAVGNFIAPGTKHIVFDTLSGELFVEIEEDGVISMDMPAYQPKQVAVTDAMKQAYGVRPLEAWLARDLVCVLPTEAAVRNARPDTDILLELPGLTQAITAQADAGSPFDCVSRCFAPELDVYEDPVTGSAHCAIAPIWAEKLGKNDIKAFQASKRTGILNCRVEGDRVKISGPAVLYARAELNI